MIFPPSKGIIALDIDGTVTAQAHEIDCQVIDALNQIALEGWKIIFITGRPFQWAEPVLSSLSFSYVLAVQNGALLLEMPLRQVIACKSLTKECLIKLEAIGREFETDFVVYSGFENDDWCYFRPSSFAPSQTSYLSHRVSFLGEKWHSLDCFCDLPVSSFSSIKFFVTGDRALQLSERIEKDIGLHAPPNRDPFNPAYFVIQATHKEANKGAILREYVKMTGTVGPIIAAGDDYNDWTMLAEADIKIVMANAPSSMLAMADIVAPPATQLGLIQGLQEAISRF